MKVNAARRKSEDVNAGSLKLKKRKKQWIVNEDSQSSPKDTLVINSSTKLLIGKKIWPKVNKTASISTKSPKENHANKSKIASPTAVNLESAPEPNESKKVKKNKLRPQIITSKVPSSAVAPFSSQAVTSDKLKKKKKKKLLYSDQNLSGKNAVSYTPEKASLNNPQVMKKKKKKKKKQSPESSNHISKINTETPASDGLENSHPFQSPPNKKKKKSHNENEKKFSSQGKEQSFGKQNIKEAIDPKHPKRSDSPRVSKNPSQLVGQKESDEENGSNNVQRKALKGKALKRHIAKLIKTISKLKDFKTTQVTLLEKAVSDEKKRKIQLQIKKMKKTIKKLESEVSGYSKSSGQNSEVINKRVYRRLPDDPPPVKKKDKSVELKEFLQNQMKASRFRWLNENLYTSSSEEAQGFFKDDPESFKAYHEGYSEQVAKWPLNPVNVLIKELKSLPKDTVIADLGCGEAKLAAGLQPMKVHSLDFIALKPEVIACDMAHCPLLRSSVDVAVFCLSLMGTNISDFLLEANRILKIGGIMEIAEVESRFDSIDDFIKKVHKYGFQLKKKSSTGMFFFLTFKKKQDVSKTGKLPEFNLKACVYKKR